MAMFQLALCYDKGIGTKKDINKASDLFLKSAEGGNAQAQLRVGLMYLSQKYFIDELKIFMRQQDNSKYDEIEALYREREALKWFTKAAEQGDPEALYYSAKLLFKTNEKEEGANYFKKAAEKDHGLAQSMWGNCLYYGNGVIKNKLEAVKWFRKAAEKNIFAAQFAMALVYLTGEGDVKNEKEAYKWALIALTHASDDESTKNTKEMVSHLESILTKPQIDEARQMAKSFLSGNQNDISESPPEDESAKNKNGRSGTGFFITTNGFIITNRHVVENASKIEVITTSGTKIAQVVKSDISHDLALLKIDGEYDALAIMSSKEVKMGHSAFTIGFPNINLQGFSPKYTKGDIAALSGIGDDSSCFQISVPIQPGNSGGALFNDQGNVIGVICSKLSAEIALDSSGSLPENVNYAIKSSFLLAFLESVDKLKDLLICPASAQIAESDILDKATTSTVLIFAYTD
jgi:TPR repeat protein